MIKRKENPAKAFLRRYIGLCGQVDAILLTGGIAHSRLVTDRISDYCRFIAPIEIYPGENELQSLAMNAIRVLAGQIEAKNY